MRSFDCGEQDFVACGAAFEDNPIWADRQVNGIRNYVAPRVSQPGDFLKMMSEIGGYTKPEEPEGQPPDIGYDGMNDERMRVDDGGSKCRAYERRA
jgi:hypothetical protein